MFALLLFLLSVSIFLDAYKAFGSSGDLGALIEDGIVVPLIAFLIFLSPLLLVERFLAYKAGRPAPARRSRRAAPAPVEFDAPRLQKARALREQILDDADAAGKAALKSKVDAVLKELERSEGILQKLSAVLAAGDRASLVQDEEAHRAQAVGSGAKARLELADELRVEIEQLDALEERRQELEVQADRLLAELRQLRLAVLSAGAGGAMLDSAGVQSALSDLDRATAEVQDGAAAAVELRQLLG